jgi:ABC-type nitrate/sulfonate/bicarbonate transport system permease component
LIITLLVEIVTGVPGLGALLGEAQQNFQSALVYGLLIVAGVLGYLVNWLVTTLDGQISARLGAVAR